MQKINLKFLTCLAATTAALVSLIASAQAQTVTPLVGFVEQTWQYYQNGDQPAPSGQFDWKQPTYNDSAWNTGYGFFAYEPDNPNVYSPINTTLTYYAAPPNYITSYYFRTHFNFATSTNNVFLYFTNVVDDGCVVYLNGFEVYRLHMAAGTVTYPTLASGGPAAEGTNELVTILNSPRLRQGDNVLAVEVHQSSTNSSDIAWDLGLAYRTAIAITITQQPPATVQLVEIQDDLDLSIGVSGDDPHYWWFRNNVFIQGQTNADLEIRNISISQTGTYYCVVSNAINGARSSNTVVTIVRDTFGPELIGAVLGEGETNRILALFNEDIARFNTNYYLIDTNKYYFMSGTNILNYTLTELATSNNIPVTVATVGTGQKSVRLTLATNIDCAKEYVLKISNITDTRTNLIMPNSVAFVGCVLKTNLIPFQDHWDWAFSSEGQKVATNWYTTNFVYDPFAWYGGSAPFYNLGDCVTTCFGSIGGACTSIGTPISIGYRTYCFRNEFVLSSNTPTAGLLRLTNVIDDAAIFYLNGVEIGRYAIPAGIPVNHDYFAPNCIEPSCTFLQIAVSNLRVGTNLFCVEVHDCNEFVGDDICFGSQVDLLYTNQPVIPSLNITRTGNRRGVILSWSPKGWRLQSTTNLANSNSWVNITPPTTNVTGYTNPAATTERQRYYRLKYR